MNLQRKQQFDEVLLRMAEELATMSYATRTQVGAILYNGSRIISMGWNGMPSGFPNDEIESINSDGSKTTNPLVLHAESNAILKCAAFGSSSEGSTLYCSISTCVECAKLCIQAGIKRFIYRDDYRIPDGLDVLKRAGIEVIKLPRIHFNERSQTNQS